MASSSAMDVDRPKIDVDAYLTKAASASPASLRSYFEAFGNLHRRKLWHQLTDKLFAFAAEPDSAPYRVDVFENFVRDFEGKLNPLRLVEFAVTVSQTFDNPEKHVSFLSSLLARLPSDSSQVPSARVLLLSSRARAKLLYGDLPSTRTDLDDAFKILDTELSGKGVDTTVHAAYYACAADYYKARAEYGPYYRNGLLFLACIDIAQDLTAEDRVIRAHDLALAALLGDSIYNFGELLMHPVLDSLDGTQHDWLKKLLFTFNEGAIGKFEALAPMFPKEPILQNNYPFLRQKICLMALIESVFRRDAYDRTLAFSTIAAETRLPAEEVEHLLMKALSLKLIRGTLDQVTEKASITWVQPRVLSREQIGALAGRLDVWCKKLGAVEDRVGSGVVGVAA